MKLLKTLILILASFIVCYVLFILGGQFYHVLGMGQELIISVEIPDKNYMIRAYYDKGLGATASSGIRIVKVYDFLNFPVQICFLDNYTDVKGIKPISPTEIEVLAGGKGKFSKPPDTLRIKIE